MVAYNGTVKPAPPMEDLLDGMLMGLVLDCPEQQAEARAAWGAVVSVVESEGSHYTLSRYEVALEDYVKKLVRSAYWRGYYTGQRETGRATLLPSLELGKNTPAVSSSA